jgi:uncharacterized membrane protein SirB2
MSAFLWIKAIHVGSVGLSIAGFTARGVLMLRGSPLLAARFVRVAPHVVDSALLASAVWLAWFLRQYPFVDGWITAKVLGLLAYIALGTIALRRGRSRRVRAAAFAAALATVAYVVTVALAHDPRGPLALLSAA